MKVKEYHVIIDYDYKVIFVLFRTFHSTSIFIYIYIYILIFTFTFILIIFLILICVVHLHHHYLRLQLSGTLSFALNGKDLGIAAAGLTNRVPLYASFSLYNEDDQLSMVMSR